MSMYRIIDIPVLVLLFILVYQDFKERMVSGWIYPVIGTLWTVRTAILYGNLFFYTDFLFNMGLLAFYLCIIRLYGKLSGRKISEVIGTGDLWFIGLLSVVFPTPGLLLFIVISFGAALCWWIFIRSKRGIPLVGIQALCYILSLVCPSVYSLFTFFEP